MNPKISLIVPAHNEAAFLPACLDAAARSAEKIDHEVEILVVLNRCTDETEAIARSRGCVIVREDAKNLSLIRNAGAAAARGEILRLLEAGRHVGGGAFVLPERWSLGIVASVMSILPYLAFSGVSFGLFWCRAEDFHAIGGFDARLVSVEDVDFAQRLKAHGRKSGRKWGTIFRAPVVTSCRKFDEFGDWYLVRNPGFVRRVFRGTDRKAADHYWYDVRSE